MTMRSWLLCLATPVLVTCREPTEPHFPPQLRGTITSRASVVVVIQTPTGPASYSSPRMLVEAVPGAGPGANCDQAALFAITGDTFVRTTTGIRADTSLLVLGQRVSVWTYGVLLSSCPMQAHADTVQLE
jgi:hypothetical protein